MWQTTLSFRSKIFILKVFLLCLLLFSTTASFAYGSQLNVNQEDTSFFIDNSFFVFHPNHQEFSVGEFIEGQSSDLKNYRYVDKGQELTVIEEGIEEFSYKYSLNPKLFLALIEYCGNSLSLLCLENVDSDIYTQLEVASNILYDEFYTHTSINEKGITVADPMAATDALTKLISQMSIPNPSRENPNSIQGIIEAYSKLFNEPISQQTMSVSSEQSIPNFHYPWLGDETLWKIGSKGPHSGYFRAFPPGSTISPGPQGLLDSYDFIPPHKYNIRTDCSGSNDPKPECNEENRGISPDWALASLPGSVIYSGNSMVVVNHVNIGCISPQNIGLKSPLNNA